MEEILEPDLVICDAHHHLWEGDRGIFPSPYLVDDLRADIESGHRVEKTVYVECLSHYRESGPQSHRPIGETEYVVKNEPTGLIAGIVGYVDLRLPDAEDVLAEQIDVGAGRFRGIRQVTVWDSSLHSPRPIPPNMLANSIFRSGLGLLERAGLTLDTYVHHTQLREVTDLARAFPELTIVVDHLGSPIGVGAYREWKDDVKNQWRSALTELAECPNVRLKIGGMAMPSLGNEWHTTPNGVSADEIVSSYRDDIRWCIEQFGANRCMFESNFPVDKTGYSYLALWNAFKRIVEDASPAEKQALFYGTASTTYQI